MMKHGSPTKRANKTLWTRITSLLSVCPSTARARRALIGINPELIICVVLHSEGFVGKRSAMMPKNFEGFLVHRFLRLELHVKNTSRQTRVSGIFFSKWQQPFNATSPPNASATTIIASSITITIWSRKP